MWDEYKPDTLKQQAWDKRGKGVRRRVAPDNAISKNWGEFLRLAEIKKDLFCLFKQRSYHHINIQASYKYTAR